MSIANLQLAAVPVLEDEEYQKPDGLQAASPTMGSILLKLH